jgi:hypothetical protein
MRPLIRRQLSSRIRATFLSAIVLFLCGQSAQACLCGGTRSPCDSLNGDSTIFLGTVESIRGGSFLEFIRFWKAHPEWSWKERLGIFEDILQVTFSVQESYKGSSAKEITIRINKFVGACGFEWKKGDLYFKKGEQYLVYAFKDGDIVMTKGDLLWTTHCTRTRIAKDAQTEIDTLRTIRDLPPSRVLGRYTLWNDAITQSPAVGQRITLTGKNGQQWTDQVRGDGRFWFSGLPADEYHVATTEPGSYALGGFHRYDVRVRDEDLRIRHNPAVISVGAGTSCVEMALTAAPDGRISGTVVDSKGKPLRDVRIRLWDAAKVDDLDRWWIGYTSDMHGRFAIGPVPPGNYVLGAYVRPPGKQDTAERPALLFYGGVSDPSKSKAISLKFAQHITNARLVIPRPQ